MEGLSARKGDISMARGKGNEDAVLKKDSEMQFPHFTVLKASAGSGKTRTLTKRFVQFILSGRIPKNRLRNVLAVTFSNNAAQEMKERVLRWLKAVHFGREQEVAELSGIVSLPPEVLVRKAGLLIDDILGNYADFQVRTIDSFMTSVFKASAIDFGYNPDFDILMSSDELMAYSFNLFLRDVREGSARAALLGGIVDSLLEHKKTDAAYVWDPSPILLEEIRKIYRRLAATGKRLKQEDYTAQQREIQEKLAGVLEAIEREVASSGLKRHGNSTFDNVLSLVRAKTFPDLIGKGFKNPPVTKPGRGSGDQAAYDRILLLWAGAEGLKDQYAVLYAHSSAMPYAKAYEAFSNTVERAKRQQGKVFIEDVSLHLSEYLSSAVVPDVYFRIGDTIFHFFIDEFQDTSPIQWKNLFPLVENSLSQGGSLFAVGDTKQAIYGFRNADYTIMKGLEAKSPFRSARHEVTELGINYRSCRRVLQFSEKVFHEKLAQHPVYGKTGAGSGLTSYVQKDREGEADEGHAEVILLDRSGDDPAERVELQGLVEGLRSRGCRWGEIAVLTQRNEDAVRATTWLNEKGIPFISYSSLDVRRRKVTGELVALLNFLDSPTDDFSFGVFVLGEIFGKAVSRRHPGITPEVLREFCFAHRDEPPLYKAFQKEFGGLWDEYFEGLFRATGFLPVYDLVTEVFAVFRVFEVLPGEEAALIRVLEVVKDFEGLGFNSLKDFLGSASGGEDDESEWDMSVPKNIDAVKVMTIHKAKGLGFPVVIVLLYEVRSRGFDYIVKEEGEEITLLKINRAIAGCDEGLRELYEKEQMKELVNRLNSLYVGFTRPERELYVLGVRSSEKGYPFDLLPAGEFPRSGQEALCGWADAGTAAVLPASPLLHRSRPLGIRTETEGAMTVQERRRGEFIHRVLAEVTTVGEGFEAGLEQVIHKVMEETGADFPAGEVKDLVMAVTHGRETAAFFIGVPGRVILREQEYVDRTGRLFRMDRVVIDREEVAVIDFKTGKNPEMREKYREQMDTYIGVLRDVYPGKKVRGLISLADLGQAEERG